MPTTDKRVDAYIGKAPDFAQPILNHVRAIVHEACPDVEETIKWGVPTFMHNGIVCAIAGFKEYCAVNFWKASLIPGLVADSGGSAGSLGKIYKISDLPAKRALIAFVKKAAALNDDGVKVPRRAPQPRPVIAEPDYFLAALKKNRKAQAAYEKFPPSHKREYLEWLLEAKTEPTRERRLAQAVEWIAEGKQRNWKYSAVGGRR
jgi:hypothetical protein